MRRAVRMSLRDCGEVRANSRAVALPMPLEAPVMRIVLPERRFETAVDMVRWVVLKWETLGGLRRVLV